MYSIEDPVYVKDFQTKLWQKGKIVKVLSPVTYVVQVGGNIWKHVHANDIRIDPALPIETEEYRRSTNVAQDLEVPPTCNVANSDSSKSLDSSPIEDTVQGREEESVGTTPLTDDNVIRTPVSTTNTMPSTAVCQTIRYGRIIKPPKKLDL